MEANELKFWIAFNRVPRIGRARFMVLESYFGTMDRAWHASGSDLKDAGLDSKTAQLVVTGRATI